jgi:hypothetical protein
LPPVQQGREFDSLDTTGNSETKEQPVEMSFHSTPCHVELGCDFGVVASLQEQVYDLLFARTEPNSLLFHPILPFFWICLTDEVRGLVTITISHSIHVAIVRRIPAGERKSLFHRHLQTEKAFRKWEFIYETSGGGAFQRDAP